MIFPTTTFTLTVAAFLLFSKTPAFWMCLACPCRFLDADISLVRGARGLGVEPGRFVLKSAHELQLSPSVEAVTWRFFKADFFGITILHILGSVAADYTAFFSNNLSMIGSWSIPTAKIWRITIFNSLLNSQVLARTVSLLFLVAPFQQSRVSGVLKNITFRA